MSSKYYYLGMTQQDFTKNQVIEEIIRERTNYYINRKDYLNFWVLMSPVFLSNKEITKKILKTNFYKNKQTELEYNDKIYSSVVLTTDYDYISWLKLRLGYFENIDSDENIGSSFRSDGIYGTFENNEILNPFETNKNNLHPSILVNKYKRSLETYYNF